MSLFSVGCVCVRSASRPVQAKRVSAALTKLSGPSNASREALRFATRFLERACVVHGTVAVAEAHLRL